MRRSLTTSEVYATKQRPLIKRAITVFQSPCIRVVGRSLDRMSLSDSEVPTLEGHNEDADENKPILSDVATSCDQESREERDDSLVSSQHSYTEIEQNQNDEGMETKEEKISEDTSFETSTDHIPSVDCVHKSLKDLIYKTNKELYQIDSNKVRYKAGLSRKGAIIPSLHQKKNSKLAAGMPPNNS